MNADKKKRISGGLCQRELSMDIDQNRLNEVTEKIIGCAYAVANGLGCGFLEKVYEKHHVR
jgi:hypothetical protein